MKLKLLRPPAGETASRIQSGEIKPVGDNATQTVDVRLIAATNRDLQERIRQGLFREDLFYRVNVFPILIPPLRDRTDDIPMLVLHFLDRFSVLTGKLVRGIDPTAQELLIRYPWPGNVRELENEIERGHILAGEGGNISVRCLSPRIRESIETKIDNKAVANPVTLKQAIEQIEKSMIQDALDNCSGNRSIAARRLGLSRQGLLNKIHKFGVDGQ
jgi:transcriptional regulator with PAS, ATPase and Fis domain